MGWSLQNYENIFSMQMLDAKFFPKKNPVEVIPREYNFMVEEITSGDGGSGSCESSENIFGQILRFFVLFCQIFRKKLYLCGDNV
ncbi:MAG: hypothetical protein K6C10_08010 [Prevotella sp.]|nr:hypothetical protein [Prevotella sp.]